MEDGLLRPANCLDSNLRDGVAGTFIPTRGTQQIVIDYIMHSSDIHISKGSVLQYQSVGIHSTPCDHVPIGAGVIFLIKQHCVFDKRRVIAYDQDKFKNAELCGPFIEDLLDGPTIPYDMCNTSHCHMLDNHVHTCLINHFELEVKVKPKLSCISSATFQEMKTNGVTRKRCGARTVELAVLPCAPASLLGKGMESWLRIPRAGIGYGGSGHCSSTKIWMLPKKSSFVPVPGLSPC